MKNYKKDLFASCVVFLVALPLAMGIAVASGYPPVAGLITGIVGGVIVGLFSGSPLQVSGPAAGLTVLVLAGVQKFGLPTMGLVIFLAGLLQVLGASARMGRWIRAVSPTVLTAMLAGIGVLIVLTQLRVLVDFNTIAIGILTIFMMVFWKKIAKGKLALIPAPLVAVATSAVVASSLQLKMEYVDIPAAILSTWKISLPDFSNLFTNGAILIASLQLAIIASAESLLCAAAVDQMHNGVRTRFDRELAAQGIGNMFCGVLGVLPLTGVIVRSSANVDAGARTRLSSILHGCWLFLFVCLLPGVLSFIPIAGLAGLLIYAGFKLFDVGAIKQIAKKGRSELAIYGTTILLVISVDLLVGITTGIMLSILKTKLTGFSLHLGNQVERETGRRTEENNPEMI